MHHNISFGENWRSTFREIIRDGRLMSDPSFLLSNPSTTDPDLAPAGRQTYYLLFPAPNTTAPLNWADLRERYVAHMRETVQRRGLPGFTDAIDVEHAVTPADWEAQGLAAGTPFAAAHLFGQSGPFRFPTIARSVENLVFCGSNTQPGVGVPMVLLSGKLAAERIVGPPDGAVSRAQHIDVTTKARP
jgi:phytoene desaturase